MDEKKIYLKDTKEWREWLEKNHLKESKIALLNYKKHTGKPSMGHRESMEEAICFGWIDTTIKKIDEDTYIRRFSRRTDKSRWSSNTLSYAKRLVKEGKMTPEGLRRYKEGLKKETIDFGLVKDQPMPADLRKELEMNKKAKDSFEKFAPSYKRMYFRWIEKAKLSETRRKRVKSLVDRALDNRKNWNQ